MERDDALAKMPFESNATIRVGRAHRRVTSSPEHKRDLLRVLIDLERRRKRPVDVLQQLLHDAAHVGLLLATRDKVTHGERCDESSVENLGQVSL